MIISTTNLNNIENKITTSQIEGIEFITVSYDVNTNTITLNASYSDLINLLTNNKLPILKSLDNNGYECDFINSIYYNEDFDTYDCKSSQCLFTAPNATTNFSISQEENQK